MNIRKTFPICRRNNAIKSCNQSWPNFNMKLAQRLKRGMFVVFFLSFVFLSDCKHLFFIDNVYMNRLVEKSVMCSRCRPPIVHNNNKHSTMSLISVNECLDSTYGHYCEEEGKRWWLVPYLSLHRRWSLSGYITLRIEKIDFLFMLYSWWEHREREHRFHSSSSPISLSHCFCPLFVCTICSKKYCLEKPALSLFVSVSHLSIVLNHYSSFRDGLLKMQTVYRDNPKLGKIEQVDEQLATVNKEFEALTMDVQKYTVSILCFESLYLFILRIIYVKPKVNLAHRLQPPSIRQLLVVVHIRLDRIRNRRVDDQSMANWMIIIWVKLNHYHMALERRNLNRRYHRDSQRHHRAHNVHHIPKIQFRPMVQHLVVHFRNCNNANHPFVLLCKLRRIVVLIMGKCLF